jgi:hypothetical protein
LAGGVSASEADHAIPPIGPYPAGILPIRFFSPLKIKQMPTREMVLFVFVPLSGGLISLWFGYRFSHIAPPVRLLISFCAAGIYGWLMAHLYNKLEAWNGRRKAS